MGLSWRRESRSAVSSVWCVAYSDPLDTSLHTSSRVVKPIQKNSMTMQMTVTMMMMDTQTKKTEILVQAMMMRTRARAALTRMKMEKRIQIHPSRNVHWVSKLGLRIRWIKSLHQSPTYSTNLLRQLPKPNPNPQYQSPRRVISSVPSALNSMSRPHRCWIRRPLSQLDLMSSAELPCLRREWSCLSWRRNNRLLKVYS